MGGDPINLPWDEILKQSRNPDKPDEKPDEDNEIVDQFPEATLPRDSVLLKDATHPRAIAVRDYLCERGLSYLDLHPFYWSPEYPDCLIIPWLHHKEKLVGWVGRNIYKKAGEKGRFVFYEPKPAHYMFNQHLIRTHAGRKLFVVEGELDAIPLKCIASRSSKLTKQQINILRLSGKDIVLIPDRDTPRSFLSLAKEEGWYVACPRWISPTPGKEIKDVSSAVQTFGRLYTIESIMQNITNNWIAAESFYTMHSKSKKK